MTQKILSRIIRNTARDLNPDAVLEHFVAAGWHSNSFPVLNVLALHPIDTTISLGATAYWALIGTHLQSGEFLWVFPDERALILVTEIERGGGHDR